MSPSPRPSETADERAARWAAEGAQAKPRSRAAGFVADYLPRAIGGLVALAFVGGVVFVALDIAHRGRPGGTKGIGWITAGTCFAADPDDYFTGTESVGELPTVDCAKEHRAEAYLSVNLKFTQAADPRLECADAWAEQSDISLEVSGIHITTLVKKVGDSVPDQALCVAVEPEPVKGGRKLQTWDSHGTPDSVV